MPKKSREILFGFHSVAEALRAERREFEAVYISDRRSAGRADKITALAGKRGVKVEECDSKRLDKLTRGGVHQGIAAKTSVFPVRNGLDILPEIRERKSPCFILVLESIEDPHNLGALIRTALCAGVDHILIPRNRSAVPSPTVSRTSAGAMEHTEIYMMTNTSSVLRGLKEQGVWISGLDARGTSSLYESDLTGSIALIVGGEHKGIRPGVQKECDFLLSIPISGGVSSLNASVAGGVAMYEARRQRL
ncbi:23S rRNA (guanosine(2251)-2'-O)-methyltransferase RlmB [Desulfospira joergensenii]|uniref:23S rRNA (guanosine(2251)-2'-O)-methyltransferase RlmB n=1 Tax=Desulfospira joergensenii TaxID=53329 RepID=UPI0003B33E08|nr:23S rRNA (guanosine(2251)-2'-O)-methyltransferase RlmB [Desulfospira joergensenii]